MGDTIEIIRKTDDNEYLKEELFNTRKELFELKSKLSEELKKLSSTDSMRYNKINLDVFSSIKNLSEKIITLNERTDKKVIIDEKNRRSLDTKIFKLNDSLRQVILETDGKLTDIIELLETDNSKSHSQIVETINKQIEEVNESVKTLNVDIHSTISESLNTLHNLLGDKIIETNNDLIDVNNVINESIIKVEKSIENCNTKLLSESESLKHKINDVYKHLDETQDQTALYTKKYIESIESNQEVLKEEFNKALSEKTNNKVFDDFIKEYSKQNKKHSKDLKEIRENFSKISENIIDKITLTEETSLNSSQIQELIIQLLESKFNNRLEKIIVEKIEPDAKEIKQIKKDIKSINSDIEKYLVNSISDIKKEFETNLKKVDKQIQQLEKNIIDEDDLKEFVENNKDLFKGEKGDKPAHMVQNGWLFWENPDGTWGTPIKLKSDTDEHKQSGSSQNNPYVSIIGGGGGSGGFNNFYLTKLLDVSNDGFNEQGKIVSWDVIGNKFKFTYKINDIGTSTTDLWTANKIIQEIGNVPLGNYQLLSEKNQTNGYVGLNSEKKIDAEYLPDSVIEYKGTWNALTNNPTLVDGTGNTGDFYVTSVEGTQTFGGVAILFTVGDWVMYRGGVWKKEDQDIDLSGYVKYTGNTTDLDMDDYWIKAGKLYQDKVYRDTLSSSGGWYRFAVSNIVTGANFGLFDINWTGDIMDEGIPYNRFGGNIQFFVSGSFGINQSTNITLLNSSASNSEYDDDHVLVDKIRLVVKPASSPEAENESECYLEYHQNTSDESHIKIFMNNSNGWNILTTIIDGDIPADYTSIELNTNKNFSVKGYENEFSIDREGVTRTDNDIISTDIYQDKKIYSTALYNTWFAFAECGEYEADEYYSGLYELSWFNETDSASGKLLFYIEGGVNSSIPTLKVLSNNYISTSSYIEQLALLTDEGIVYPKSVYILAYINKNGNSANNCVLTVKRLQSNDMVLLDTLTTINPPWTGWESYSYDISDDAWSMNYNGSKVFINRDGELETNDPITINATDDTDLGGDNLQNNGLILDGAIDTDKQILFRDNGVDKWAIQGSWRNEDGRFMYFYNLDSEENPLVMSRNGRFGFNRPTSLVSEYVAYNGTGLNDVVASGNFEGNLTTAFRIYIDSVGANDTFRWEYSINAGGTGATWTAGGTLIPCQITPYELRQGVSIQFGAITGHAIGDSWSVRGYSQDPPSTFDIKPPKLHRVMMSEDAGVTFTDYTYKSATTQCSIADSFQILHDATCYLYLGNASKWSATSLILSQYGVGGTFKVQYLNGSDGWTDVPNTIDETLNLTTNGNLMWDNTAFVDWAKKTIDGTENYWIRLVPVTTYSTIPELSSICRHSFDRLSVYSAHNDLRPAFKVEGDGVTKMWEAERVSTVASYRNAEYITEQRLKEALSVYQDRISYLTNTVSGIDKLFSLTAQASFSNTYSVSQNTQTELETWIEFEDALNYRTSVEIGDRFDTYLYLQKTTANRGVTFQVDVLILDSVGTVLHTYSSAELVAPLTTNIEAYDFIITANTQHSFVAGEKMAIRVKAKRSGSPLTTQNILIWGGGTYNSQLDYPSLKVTLDRLFNYFEEDQDTLKNQWKAKGTGTDYDIELVPKGAGIVRTTSDLDVSGLITGSGDVELPAGRICSNIASADLDSFYSGGCLNGNVAIGDPNDTNLQSHYIDVFGDITLFEDGDLSGNSLSLRRGYMEIIHANPYIKFDNNVDDYSIRSDADYFSMNAGDGTTVGTPYFAIDKATHFTYLGHSTRTWDDIGVKWDYEYFDTYIKGNLVVGTADIVTNIDLTGNLNLDYNRKLMWQDIYSITHNGTDFIFNDNIDLGDNILKASGVTLAEDELLTIGTGTLTHDGTEFVANDDVNLGANDIQATEFRMGTSAVMKFNAITNSIDFIIN